MSIQIRNTKYEILPAEAGRAARHGFSLTEVLIAVGLLAVGMLFIAGVFPVSIHFATVVTERTIAATVADEAFAKIKLYGVPALSYTNQTPYAPVGVPFDEYAYPSTPTADPNSRRYWWAAVCRRVDVNNVQVTVFVSRKVGMTTKYYTRNPLPPPLDNLTQVDRPVPVFVSVTAIAGGRADELSINDALGLSNFINDGYTIADDATGNIYRVLERYRSPNDSVIRLDKDRQGTISRVWAVPPPVNGGRYPCIGVYQKIIRF
jgi:prepilin-type N-terminal cleavage/methylation domain-containing protein